MMEFIASPAFLGIILMTGGTCFLLWLTFVSWFVGRPRRFFLACLTYADDELQQISRTMWIFSWILITSGALVVVCTREEQYPFWMNTISVMYYVLLSWLTPKLLLLVVLFCIGAGKVLAALWRWAILGESLFSRK